MTTMKYFVREGTEINVSLAQRSSGPPALVCPGNLFCVRG